MSWLAKVFVGVEVSDLQTCVDDGVQLHVGIRLRVTSSITLPTYAKPATSLVSIQGSSPRWAMSRTWMQVLGGNLSKATTRVIHCRPGGQVRGCTYSIYLHCTCQVRCLVWSAICYVRLQPYLSACTLVPSQKRPPRSQWHKTER
jgi:hypothetical protein